MKHLKFIILAVVAAACTMTFTACGDDEPSSHQPPQGGNGGNGGGGSNPPAFQGARLLEIAEGNYSTQFSYNNNGSLASVKDDDEVYRFTYSGNTVTMESAGYKVTFTLGGNGYATSGRFLDLEDGEVSNITFSYNNAGQLCYVKWEDLADNDSEEYTITYDANGDAVKTVINDGSETETINIVYDLTPTPNVTGFMNYNAFLGVDLDECGFAYFAGILGKGTTHLPNVLYFSDGGSDHLFWTLDTRNYPQRLETIYKYDGNEYTETPVTFTWQ